MVQPFLDDGGDADREPAPANMLADLVPADDVSRQLDTEEALRRSRDSLRLALDAAGMGASTWYSTSGRVEWDVATEALFGLAPGTFAGTYDAWMALIHPDDVAFVERALADAVSHVGSYHLEHRIVRPTGEVRWLERRGETFLDDAGGLAGTRGVTMDVTDRHRAADALDRLRTRLEVLAEAGLLVGRSLLPIETIRDLGQAIVPRFADGYEMDLVDGDHIRRFVTNPESTTLQELAEIPDDEDHPSRRVLRVGRRQVMRLGESPGYFGSEAVPSSARALGIQAAVLAPVIARGRVIGVLATSWREEPDDIDDRANVVSDLAVRAGLAIDNARLYQIQRSTLIDLQRSLLPHDLAAPPDCSLAVRYQPGVAGTEVGGDWYDADTEPSGVVHLSVGDVMGKGTQAAAVMVRAQTALRALLREQPPAAAVAQLAALPSVANAGYLTVLAATLHPDGTAVFCNAGHLPPLLSLTDGTVRRLEVPPTLPLGFERDRTFRDTTHRLPPASRLVMYTDGLVERPGETIDIGLDRLAEVLELGQRDSVEQLADRIIDELHIDARDDAALIILQTGYQGRTPAE